MTATHRRRPAAPPPLPLERRLGLAIVRLRRARGLSQERLALVAGIARTYARVLERGEASASVGTLVKVSAALELPVSALIAEAEREPVADPTGPLRRGR